MGMRYADLSKGQRMLEILKCAFALQSPLISLDEPFSGLDPVARRRVTDGIIEHMCGLWRDGPARLALHRRRRALR